MWKEGTCSSKVEEEQGRVEGGGMGECVEIRKVWVGRQGMERTLGVGWMLEPYVNRGSGGQNGGADARGKGLWMLDINGGKRGL